MKKLNYFLMLLSLSLLCRVDLSAQSEATSPRMSFNIAKEVKPPLWEMVEEPRFIDEDGNNAIDANETCKIVMKVKNVGMGDGLGLTAKITADGATNGIQFSDKKLSTIPAGGIATIEYPIKTNMQTTDGVVSFTVYVDEPMGFNTDKYMLRIQSRKFQEPLIVVKDYVVSGDKGDSLEKQQPFNLQVLVQNVQQGVANNVRVELKHSDNVFNINGQDLYTFSEWAPGETQTLTFPLIVNARFEGTTLPLTVKISEQYGKCAQDKIINLTLNQPLASRTINVESQISQTNIQDAQLRSDVDRNIPKTNKSNSHRFAIVVGNQDYHSHQKDLKTEQDVPFAFEDASVFKQYCVQTLGVEEGNIVLLTDATAAQMNQQIYRIARLAARDSESEIIVYYAGHGYPDEKTKEPYLIPVDVNASNLSDAISLYDLYGKLSTTGARRVTVFLDACFSGGGRDAGLIASRGVRVTPKRDVLTGNLVVFSATTADQTALPYKDKSHGMFTYFLLKKLQESQGQCTYSELFQYLSRYVGESSLRVNRKDQTPEVNTAPQVQDIWGSWQF
ncbi:MAG: caspase family protein [Bacteroidales bacterium]|nr:caspase family protein [Bacteroidales bacterium]